MWRAAAKFLLSAGLIWLLFRGQDVAAIARQMLRVEPWMLVATVVLLAGLAFLVAARWGAILDALQEPISFRVLVPVVWIGLFFNQLLPSAVGGDTMRVWLSHKSGLSVTTAVTSTMIDRLCGLLALIILATLVAPGLLALGAGPPILSGVLLMLVAGYAAFAAALMLDRLPERLRDYRVVAAAAGFGRALRLVLLSRRCLPRILAYGLANHLGIVVAVYLLAKGLGLSIDFFDCLVIVPVAALALTIPISIAGWGLREGVFVAAFGMVGLAAHDALALSLLYGLTLTLLGLAGGIVWIGYPIRGPGAAASIAAVGEAPRKSATSL